MTQLCKFLKIQANHFFFFFFATRCSLWDLSSLTRDLTHTPCSVEWRPNHWPSREFPQANLYDKKFISNCLSGDTQNGEIVKGDKETFESDGACECVFSHVQSCRLFVTLWIVAHFTPLSIGFFF